LEGVLQVQHGSSFGFEAPNHLVLLSADLAFERKLGNRKIEHLLVLELKTSLVLEKKNIDDCVNSIIKEQQNR
jgi:hypothetical protein